MPATAAPRHGSRRQGHFFLAASRHHYFLSFLSSLPAMPVFILMRHIRRLAGAAGERYYYHANHLSQ